MFEPLYTREELDALKKELAEKYLSAVEPRRYTK
jgi:hypothetical protein